MTINWLGILIGILFGAGLIISDLANPDKIIGTLRFKDFHALKVIAVFVVVSMVGVWILDLAGFANFNVKPTIVMSNFIGGAFLGIGFGLTGFCPGTGLACAAAGRLDALVSVVGMFAGALLFILIYKPVVVPLEKLLNYGKITLPEVTVISRTVFVLAVLVLSLAGFLAAAYYTIYKQKKELQKQPEKLPEQLE